MKKVKVIVHNSVSLDGSVTGFEVDMGLHYAVAGRYGANAHLIGSATVKTGVELYGDGVPAEKEEDFNKPARPAHLPYWVIVDTGGVCKGLLHTARSFEYCRDVIILVSGKTGKDYLEYLEQRNYDYLVVGDEHVDFQEAFELLRAKYAVNTILIDSGPVLNGILLGKGLVDEISLLVHPVIVGRDSYNLFSMAGSGEQIKLILLGSELLDGGLVLLRFQAVAP
ncbi:MAG: dihydrofolate reductase family protein [Dehalococcoidaceae bacterium]|nr:dihydrofolate reductase family protein [Dehalococcoidaceae bacterium]